jgi:hypothetical protein
MATVTMARTKQEFRGTRVIEPRPRSSMRRKPEPVPCSCQSRPTSSERRRPRTSRAPAAPRLTDHSVGRIIKARVRAYAIVNGMSKADAEKQCRAHTPP